MNVEILNGNELIVQGGLEAGFSLYTGYPGSPVADFFNILYAQRKELAERGVKVVIANSEANAAAMASGAKMAGKDTLVVMKSMGLHVAADALSVGNFADSGMVVGGRGPGVVVVVGDDPWSISTSTPADSRYLYKHLHIPFLEPSTPQELKDWIKLALDCSRESSIYVGVLLTTFMAEGGGRVTVKEPSWPSEDRVELKPEEFNLQKNVMVPPNSMLADKAMIEERFPRYIKAYEKLELDKRFGNDSSKLGIISSGAVFEILKQVIESEKVLEQVNLYKLASSYPLSKKFLVPFLKDIDCLVVVEEKRGFLETEIKQLCLEEGIFVKVYGKECEGKPLFPAHGGLSFELIQAGLTRVFSQFHIEHCQFNHVGNTPLEQTVPKRLPTFCPGCPHRETLSLLKDLRKTLDREGIGLISHGDVGCYSLSFLQPFKEMHDLSAMGQGGSMGAGTDLFTKNPSVVLMGDSTFFHSGISSLSNSIQCGHNITYILLDNDNTAMTGHQQTPRTGESVDGEVRPRQDILASVKSMGVTDAIAVNPSDRYFYKNVLSDFLKQPGVKVIVSEKECGLTYHGRLKQQDRKLFNSGKTKATQQFYQINTFACEDCRECVELTGCPGLTQTFDAYGSKIAIDPQICVSDGYCTKIKVCPSFELVEVSDYHPSKYKNFKTQNLKNIGPPRNLIKLDDIAAGKDFRIVVIGVGGSGVTTISRVLAEAAKKMGGRTDINFKFVDQKGLAQRNGSVTSHLSFFSESKSHGQVSPQQSVDLVISPDLIEAARGYPFLSEAGHMVCDNDFQIPLDQLLNRISEYKKEDLIAELEDKLKNRFYHHGFKQKSMEMFGKPVYSSAMLLGYIFQKGFLPFLLQDLTTAIESAVPAYEVENNITAFDYGRHCSENGMEMLVEETLTVEEFENSLLDSAGFWESKDLLSKRFQDSLDKTSDLAINCSRSDLAHYVHDIYLYDRGRKFKKFVAGLEKIKNLYQGDEFKLALRIWVKTFWIKDEVFVSHLMISPLKQKIDNKKYQDLGTSYRNKYINRPEFELFGKKISFDLSPKLWMLRIMRHLRLIRWFMPRWHQQEKYIAGQIQSKLLNQKLGRSELIDLHNIKGYREIRYQSAEHILTGFES